MEVSKILAFELSVKVEGGITSSGPQKHHFITLHLNDLTQISR